MESLATWKITDIAPDIMITIFTPSFADAADTNAQNLTVKEVVARLPPEKFRVQMLYAEKPDSRIVARPNTELIAYRRHGNSLRLLARCCTTPPDVYFFPREGPLDSVFLSCRRYLRFKTAVVSCIVSAMDQGEVRPLILRSILEGDVVVGNSNFVSQSILDRFGIATSTIPDGVDRELFFSRPETRASNPQPIVLYAGAFQPMKRVPIVIKEASRRPDVRFRLAGRGVDEADCRILAERLGCRNVDFLGHLPQAQLGGEMRQADIFLFPSVSEGHPQVLIQAAACGLPCIAMDVYHPDYVASGSTGFLARSDEEVSEKLDLLLAQPELRQSFSKAAARLASNFDWERIAEQWETVLSGAVDLRRHRNRSH